MSKMEVYIFDEGIVNKMAKQISYTINEKGCFNCISHAKELLTYLLMNLFFIL